MASNSTKKLDPLEEESLFVDVSFNTTDKKLDHAVEDIFSKITFKTPKKRKDAVKNLKKHLRGVLIFCIRTYQLDPNIPIAIPFNNNFGRDSYTGDFDPINPMKYNFKKFREVIRALEKYDFIDITVGKQAYFSTGYDGKVTRLRLSKSFIKYIRDNILDQIVFEEVLLNGGMIITYKNSRGLKRVLHDYSKLPLPLDIKRTQQWLPLYNKLIKEADIRIHKQISTQVIDTTKNTSKRLFHETRYDYGGRYYGGWWTYCGREDRRYISIDDEQTVECDYSANHLYLFYGINNNEMPDHLKSAPYSISQDYPREIIKIFITRLFNFPGTKAINNHLRTVLKEKKRENKEDIELLKKYNITTSDEMNRVLDIIYKEHPILLQATDRNTGMLLMNWDSKVASYVLKEMLDLKIPTLCIHDSFIVPKSQKEQLIKAMNDAYDHLSIPLAKPPIKELDAKLVRNENNEWEATEDYQKRHSPTELYLISNKNKKQTKTKQI